MPTYVLFQFLYGAIKSPSNEVLAAPAVPFQFLYGAIKSKPPDNDDEYLTNFNSSMVRLKGRRGISCSAIRHISIPLWCD